jgi:hypothetical protein
MGTARVSDSLARPIPADPSAGDRVLPADTWPVRWARHDGLELGVRVAAMRVAGARGGPTALSSGDAGRAGGGGRGHDNPSGLRLAGRGGPGRRQAWGLAGECRR